MQGHHVRPGPGARLPIDEGFDVLRGVVARRPGADYVPDLVGKHPHQGALPGALEILPVHLDVAETPVPGPASPAGRVPGKVIVLDIDLEPGARLAFGPDEHPRFARFVVPQRSLDVSGRPLPRRQGVRDSMAP